MSDSIFSVISPYVHDMRLRKKVLQGSSLVNSRHGYRNAPKREFSLRGFPPLNSCTSELLANGVKTLCFTPIFNDAAYMIQYIPIKILNQKYQLTISYRGSGLLQDVRPAWRHPHLGLFSRWVENLPNRHTLRHQRSRCRPQCPGRTSERFPLCRGRHSKGVSCRCSAGGRKLFRGIQS